MRETHYIDIDEEVITAVSRLRQSSETDNVFVFPKRALILQSIVNLRLLDREATKLGKKIIILTQDEAGRKLAEKAGLIVEAYTDRPASLLKTVMAPSHSLSQGGTSSKPLDRGDGRQLIGTDNFFNSPQLNQASRGTSSSLTSLSPAPTPQSIRVRSADSVRLTSLNSQQSHPAPHAPSAPTARPLTTVSTSPIHRRLGHFMQRAPQEETPRTPSVAPASIATAQPSTYPHRQSWFLSGGLWYWIVSGLLVGGVGIVGWYVFFPKATVTIEPRSAEQVIRLQLSGVTSNATSETDISVRLLELEHSFQITDTPSGEGTDETGKARGRVRIYNEFSEVSQPLVATTRLETKDGKIFRLVQGIVVPGMSEKGGKREPGMIEATVVADKVGNEYAIAPTKFTIPGFKGGPKYEKFSAESLETFTGGTLSTPTAKKKVSTSDIDRARQTTETQAREYVLTEVNKQLRPGEVVMTDSLQLTRISETPTPSVGESADTLVYDGRYRAKVFVIDESLVRERIGRERLTANGVTLTPRHYDVRYTALLPRYEAGRIDMTIESTAWFQAPLTADELQTALGGLDETGIRVFLEKYPAIERLQVEFHPQWFIKTLPKHPDRLLLEIKEGKQSGS